MTFAPSPPLTIVGYHYVRPIAEGSYPSLKGREAAHFRQQLRYFRRHYTFVSIDDVVMAAGGGPALPPRPLLLTFDDGYRDHYEHAFPALREIGASGAFYPTTCAVLEHRVLDVNKIHFVLASLPDAAVLVEAIEQHIIDAQADPAVGTIAEYRAQYWTGNRFDPAPVLYCKQLLQHALPEALRRAVVDELFGRFVSRDQVGFASDLYLNVAQLQEMVDGGMHVGGHGGQHAWLDRLSVNDQAGEIDESLRLLRTVEDGVPQRHQTFCYPYGGYNGDTLALLRRTGFQAGLTVRPDIARLDRDGILELPRLDTNDFPVAEDAAQGTWTARAGTHL